MTWSRLRRAIGDTAIVHAHGLRAGVAVGAAVGPAAAPPTVLTWHNARLETGLGQRALAAAAERFAARRANVNLAASDDLAGHVRRIGGRDVRNAPVAVSLAAPTRSATDVRAELGLEPGQRFVLAVARLHPQKALDILISAASRWRADQVLVGIAGSGPLQAQLEAQIASTAAPVRLLGRRSDVSDLLNAADLVVLPSRWEARSLAAQEALLAGRPLVATSVGGMPGLLGDGALLIPAGDVEALDRAVRGLLEDPVRLAGLAQLGRDRARDWPTEADTIAQISALYAELLGIADPRVGVA
jgi:glycosyltransferase involved in cell wall biosynthesis